MKTIEKISEETTVLVEYAANACGSARVAEVFGVEDNDELKTLLSDFEEEYDEVEVDPEGATAEQDAKLNAVLESYRKKINNDNKIYATKSWKYELYHITLKNGECHNFNSVSDLKLYCKLHNLELVSINELVTGRSINF